MKLLATCKLGLERGVGRGLIVHSDYFVKHSAKQFTDDRVYQIIEAFIIAY